VAAGEDTTEAGQTGLRRLSSLRLETERLLLRLPRLEDAPGMSEYLADPEVMRFLGGTTVPPEDVPAVVQRWLDRWRESGVGPFVLERRTDRRVLGRVGLLIWDTRTWRPATFEEAGDHAQPELGWALGREHWGQGYATEAALAVRAWARHERKIGRLISLIAPGNAASQRVAERLGARPAQTVTLFDSGDAVVWEHPS
jgi:RimJ/RimL family protein N-acetyltransferase